MSIAWHGTRRRIDAFWAQREADLKRGTPPASGGAPTRKSLGKLRSEAFREWSGHPLEKRLAVV